MTLSGMLDAGVERKVDGLVSYRTCCLTSCSDLVFIKCHWCSFWRRIVFVTWTILTTDVKVTIKVP